MKTKGHKRRPQFRWAAFFIVFVAVGYAGYQTLTHPGTPLPDEWNPIAGFSIEDPVSPLTSWKVQRILNDPELCLATLEEAEIVFEAMEPLEATQHCHIRNRIQLVQVRSSRIDPLETSCAIALRIALWDRHGVQPAAREILGTEASVYRQIGSYNCRPIRTSSGTSNRWSTHSTADAIDITGFDLADGRRIRLVEDWQGNTPEAQFLRAVRDSACTWFETTLGPDYNSLHADHFHLQARGWGTCR